MRRAVAVSVLLVAVVPAATAARMRTFSTNAPLTIDLPASWRPVHADPGWRFKAVAPDFSAWTFLSARADTVDFNSYAGAFVSFEKQTTAKLGPRVVFRARAATVDGERAVQVYAAGRGTLTEYFYGFVHNGVDYVLAFATKTEDARRSKALFEAAVRSVRFKSP